MGYGPVPAIRGLLKSSGLTVDQVHSLSLPMNPCLVLLTKYPLFVLSANLPYAVDFATRLTPICLSQIDLFEINEAFAGQCVRFIAACKL